MSNKYEGIGDPIELYYTFKDEFFAHITNNIVESDLSELIIKAYNDYEFNKVRMVIDDEVRDKADIVMINSLHNIIDEVDTTAYKAWKKLDDMFMEFESMYSELIELNLQ